jgi:hypothetical protein
MGMMEKITTPPAVAAISVIPFSVRFISAPIPANEPNKMKSTPITTLVIFRNILLSNYPLSPRKSCPQA